MRRSRSIRRSSLATVRGWGQQVRHRGAPPDIDTYELDAEGRDLQLKRLAKVKAERDPVAVKEALAALSRAAEGTTT